MYGTFSATFDQWPKYLLRPRQLSATSGSQLHCEHLRCPVQILIYNMASTSVSSDCIISGERASRSSPSDNEPAVSKRGISYYKPLERKVYITHSVNQNIASA